VIVRGKGQQHYPPAGGTTVSSELVSADVCFHKDGVFSLSQRRFELGVVRPDAVRRRQVLASFRATQSEQQPIIAQQLRKPGCLGLAASSPPAEWRRTVALRNGKERLRAKRAPCSVARKRRCRVPAKVRAGAFWAQAASRP
jgi:hypothetical protein